MQKPGNDSLLPKSMFTLLSSPFFYDYFPCLLPCTNCSPLCHGNIASGAQTLLFVPYLPRAARARRDATHQAEVWISVSRQGFLNKPQPTHSLLSVLFTQRGPSPLLPNLLLFFPPSSSLYSCCRLFCCLSLTSLYGRCQ